MLLTCVCVFFSQDLPVLFDKLCWECDSVDNVTVLCVFFSQDFPVLLFVKLCWECDNVNNVTDVCVFFSQDLPVLLFVKFCSEGDNAQDAIDVAQELNGWINIIGKKVSRDNTGRSAHLHTPAVRVS